VTTRDGALAAERSAAVLDARPGSSEHRPIARRLKARGVPFLFHATHPPDDVTTVRGVPLVLKLECPERIVAAIRMLLAGSGVLPISKSKALSPRCQQTMM
jgi:hypothetical protein